MATSQPRLELRKTGFYWRRRVPARAKNRVIPAFFCFPLKTHAPREAAELAQRLRSISELYFIAETDVHPEIMTSILVDYSRFEIDGFDHLRALTGPRTRQAAEAALEIEAAAMASLRDAIFLCDHTPALSPIRDTARRLELESKEDDEDFPVLMARMVRLMIEISEERDRPAKGIFADTQPYLQMALQAPLPNPASQPTASPATTTAVRDQQLDVVSEENAKEAASAQEETVTEANEAPHEAEKETEEVHFEREGLKISVQKGQNPPSCVLGGSDGRVLDLWNAWFDYKKKGKRKEGTYIYEDEELVRKFENDAETVQSTRKMISDMIGNKPIHQVTEKEWIDFNDMLFKLPSNHGKSPSDKEQHCLKSIERETEKKARELRKAEIKMRCP